MNRWLQLSILTAVIGLTVFVAGTSRITIAAPDTEPAPAEVAAPAEAPAPITAAAVDTKLGDTVEQINWLWTCIAAFLVFFMQMGFACVEAGLTRAKNVCNIMMKNFMDFSIGSLVYWAIGFGLMFGATSGGYFGTTGFLSDPEAMLTDGKNPFAQKPNGMYAFLIFQTVFAATTATIVSGAMAERTKFQSYLVYTAIITAVIYPISGHWAWGSLFGQGKGWIESLDGGFTDFAGSAVVHLCGGAAALAGAIALGPRVGKYNSDGSMNAIPGHNLPLATIGVFVLWLGWFGFNPGSTTSLSGGDFARIAFVTNIAAAAGAVTGMITAWVLFKKPDLTMTLNGCLGGLVAITAGCAAMSPTGALIVGAIAGVLVVLSVIFFDKIGVDDPVGAVSVHCVCGAFGTIACGFSFLLRPGVSSSLVNQLIGVGCIGGYAFVATSIMFLLIKATIGLRVSQKEELEGLDLLEHGNEGYHGFMFVQGPR